MEYLYGRLESLYDDRFQDAARSRQAQALAARVVIRAADRPRVATKVAATRVAVAPILRKTTRVKTS